MKIVWDRETLKGIEKSGVKNKYGNGKRYELVEVHGKNGTYMRKQLVGKKKQEESKEREPKQEETKKPSKKTSTTSTTPKTPTYTHTVGDYVCFNFKGDTLTGEIVNTEKLGVTIKGTNKSKGIVFKLLHEDVKQVTKMMKPKDAIDFLLDKGSVNKNWRSDEYQPESCDTIKGLYETVEKIRGEFSNFTDSIKAEFEALNPIILKRPNLKGEDRIKEKLREDQKDNEEKEKDEVVYDKATDTYHCRTIRDCDGHTICVSNIEEIANILKSLDSKKEVARVKNNFATPTPVGYSDINANIKMSNGAIVELQVNTTANLVAKERYGHSLYEVYRSIESNPKYAKLAALMGKAQKSLYDLSNKYSKEGNFPTGDIPLKDGNANIFDETYKHEPFAKAIRDTVSKALPLFNSAKNDGVLKAETIKHFEHLVDYLK